MSKPDVLELLKKEKKPNWEPERSVMKPISKSPCAGKTRSIHESIKRIEEQLDRINVIDLTGVQELIAELKEPLENIQVELAEFRVLWKKKEELLDTELRIARLFEGMLQKESEKAK